MASSTSKTSLLVTLSAALLVTACGGGGGSTGSAGSSTTAATSSVTATNMQDVGAQGFSASDNLNGQVGGSTSLLSGVTTETASGGVLDVTLQQIYSALANQPAGNLATGVTITHSTACPGGGTYSSSTTLANSTRFSSGDNIAITADNCVQGATKLNGGLSITFNNPVGTPSVGSAWSATLAIKYTNFAVSVGGKDAPAINGDIAYTYNQTGAGKASFAVSGNSLQLHSTKSGAILDRSLSAYSYTGTVNAGAYTYNTNFTLAGNFPKLGNVSYTVKTLVDFKGSVGGYPTQGSILITAGDKTSATVTAIDGISVKVGLDKNGDGVIDQSVTTTWAALLSLI